METFEAIRKRCSMKMYLSGKEVEQDKIDKILNAACLAPSARNKQPWRFIIVKDRATKDTLAKTAFPDTNTVIGNAPVIIVLCGKAEDSITTDGKDYYLFDAGLAMENILLAATDLGLASHPMSGFNEAEIKKILQIPDDVHVIAVTPIAYPQGGSYDEASRERLSQRERKSLKDVTFSGKWGK